MLLPGRVQHLWIPRGDAGTRRIVQHMVRLARKGSRSPGVRQLALDITDGVNGHDGRAQLWTLRDWLSRRIVFVRDPQGTELLHSPEYMTRLLRDPGSDGTLRVDCDDAAILAAALGKAVGLQARFSVVGFLSLRAPFRHVWAELRDPRPDSKWVEIDPTRAIQQINPAHISRRLDVRV